MWVYSTVMENVTMIKSVDHKYFIVLFIEKYKRKCNYLHHGKYFYCTVFNLNIKSEANTNLYLSTYI